MVKSYDIYDALLVIETNVLIILVCLFVGLFNDRHSVEELKTRYNARFRCVYLIMYSYHSINPRIFFDFLSANVLITLETLSSA